MFAREFREGENPIDIITMENPYGWKTMPFDCSKPTQEKNHINMNVGRILSKKQPWKYIREYTSWYFFQGTMESPFEWSHAL